MGAIDHRLAKMILQEHKYRAIKGTVVLIGRQTISMTPKEAFALVQSEGLSIRSDAFVELDTTTVALRQDACITDRSFFSLFSDAKVMALDVSPYEGAEIIADLNFPIDQKFHNIADFIYDGSCMDNLFDPASALKNMSALLNVGGRIMLVEHGSPIQGAYVMYSPAVFFDYFAINRFSDCRVYEFLFDYFVDPWHVFLWNAYHQKEGQWKMTEHMDHRWENVVIFVIAEKGKDSTHEVSPIQGFYRGLHGTDADQYWQAFQHYSTSKRPLPVLNSTQRVLPGPAGFSFIGILANPQERTR